MADSPLSEAKTHSAIPVYPLSPLYKMHLALFPASCHACGRTLNPRMLIGAGYPFLCDVCWHAIPWVSADRACRQCASPTAEPLRRKCPVCADRTWALDGVRAACYYEGSLRRWLLQLKFYRRTDLIRMLGLLLALSLGEPGLPSTETLLVPVPLHRRRLRGRGFNQSVLLGRAWHAMVRQHSPQPIILAPGLLRRNRNTRPQLTLGADERTRNVAGAFSVHPFTHRANGRMPAIGLWPGRGESITPEGRHVILVDDIMTTGATLDACARVLKDAGAASVHAIVMARA